MGKFEYESTAFKSPNPISESEYLSHKTNLETNSEEQLYKNGVHFFKRHKISIIIILSGFTIGQITEFYEIEAEWIGSFSYIISFVFGVKFLFSLSSYVGYLSELRKFNRRFNKAIRKSEDYKAFFDKFYSDKRYYEEV